MRISLDAMDTALGTGIEKGFIKVFLQEKIDIMLN